MALTVRQVGQVAPPLKQKVEQFQQVIDNNDEIVARIREKIRRVESQREQLSTSVQQRQDDRRNLASTLARLEDALASFGVENAQLEAFIEELPRLLERISLPAGQQGGVDAVSGGGGGMGLYANPYITSQRIPSAAIELPLPYFKVLAKQFEERTQMMRERIHAMEAALTTYSRHVSGVPVTQQVEAVVRSEHAQFRDLAQQIAQAAERLERLRDAAIRTRGVPAGMLARPVDNDMMVDRPQSTSGTSIITGGSLSPAPGMMSPMALGGGGMCGQSAGGGLFGGGGGLFGQNPGGGGMMGQNPGGMMGQTPGGMMGQNPAGGGMFGQSPAGGGMFGQNPAGGGMFGQNTGGGGLFGQNTGGGGLFGQNTGGGGLFGQNTGGGGLFGQNTGGGGLFGQNTGGGLFGQNTGGGGLFGQNTGGGGLFGQNTGGGGLFGQNPAGGGMFGQQNTGGGGLFGQNPAGGGMFGQQNTGGGLFGQNTGGGGGMFGGQNTGGGGLFGQNTGGGGLFGQSAGGGGGLFGANTGGGLFG